MTNAIDYGVSLLPHSKTPCGTRSAPYLAAFSDPRAAAAFRRANPRLQASLLDAGISPDVAEQPAPKGSYPSHLQAKQEHLKSCVVDALEGDLDDVSFDDPEFDTRAFLAALGAARAYGALVPVVPTTEIALRDAAPERSRKAKIMALLQPVGCALAVLAISGWWVGSMLLSGAA